MNKLFGTIFIWFLALSLVAIPVGSGATAKERERNNEHGDDFSEKSAPAQPSDLYSSLVPTLEVTLESCYVFLQPKEQSHYFGPLIKGEKVKWLDARGNWVRVWIPRLRVSGWVRSAEVSGISNAPSNLESVPKNLLSIVTVITKRANIREGPTTGSRIIMVAKKDQEFWLLNEKEGWYQVWIVDMKRKGWIYGKIVSRHHKK